MRTLAFGEILWDIIKGEAHLGGALLNLTAHMSKTGADAYIISSVGDDTHGHNALKLLDNLNVNKDFITILNEHPTGTVDVTLHANGIPTYIINENTAWDNIKVQEQNIGKILNENWDVFCIGTLAQRTASNRTLLHHIIEQINSRHIFYDVNLRQNYFDKSWIEFSMNKATIVKVNDEEAVFLSELIFNETLTENKFAEKLTEKYNLQLVCITRGPNGAAVYNNNNFVEIPGIIIKVADTVGAGDSFSAGLLHAFISGLSAEKSAQFAVKIGGYVASHFGAIPEYPIELKNEIKAITKL